MKYCFLGLLLVAQHLYGQVVLPSLIDIGSIKPTSISFDKKARSEQPTRFTSIVIQDLRSDTLTAGYVRFSSEYKKYFRLQLEGGVGSATSFLNTFYRTGNGYDSLQLLIQLKNFFITQDYKMPSTGVNLVNDVYTSKVFVAANLVLTKGSQRYLLGKVDTLLTLNKWLGKSYDKMAKEGFISLVQKADAYVNDFKPIPLTEAAFQHMSKLPQPRPDSLKEGFYLTYQDFLEGKQTVVPVHFEQKKKARILHTVNDTAIINNSWGFVEKGTLFVRRHQYYIPLQYTFGSWSGLGMDSFEVYKMPVGTNPISLAVDLVDIAANGPTTRVEPFKLFKLNSETGKLE